MLISPFTYVLEPFAAKFGTKYWTTIPDPVMETLESKFPKLFAHLTNFACSFQGLLNFKFNSNVNNTISSLLI